VSFEVVYVYVGSGCSIRDYFCKSMYMRCTSSELSCILVRD